MDSNFSGSWRTNLAKSKILFSPPRELVVQIDHAGDHLREEIIVLKEDGSKERAVFTCSTDGGEGQRTLNGRAIRGRSYWIGNELVIESWIELGNRELHFRDCWSLAENGQMLVMAHRDDALAGQVTVLERAE